MERLQHDLIKRDLPKEMVLLIGPRQVGKTYLARQIARGYSKAVYLNYDAFEDRGIIQQAAWLPDTELLILDEIHKMPDWKSYLKGIYDTRPTHLQIFITGSARLDTMRHGGDSLVGRFFRHRLNPLSLKELPNPTEDALDRLMKRGGFPEPYLAEDDREADRWRLQYVDELIRLDIFDLEKIHDLRAMQLTLDLLRHRVGSPVSYSSLAQDVQCAPNTIRKYIEILEALFVVFRVTPFHRNIARSLVKEPKLYFYDNGMVKGNEGVCFENLMAVSLHNHANALEDYHGRRASVQYIRTKEKKEVDFVLAGESEPIVLIEAKLAETKISPSLRYFHQRYHIPAVQVMRHLRTERMVDGVELRRAFDYLSSLHL